MACIAFGICTDVVEDEPGEDDYAATAHAVSRSRPTLRLLRRHKADDGDAAPDAAGAVDAASEAALMDAAAAENRSDDPSILPRRVVQQISARGEQDIWCIQSELGDELEFTSPRNGIPSPFSSPGAARGKSVVTGLDSYKAALSTRAELRPPPRCPTPEPPPADAATPGRRDRLLRHASERIRGIVQDTLDTHETLSSARIEGLKSQRSVDVEEAVASSPRLVHQAVAAGSPASFPLLAQRSHSGSSLGSVK